MLAHSIGCIMLEQPFFFDESEWIPQPAGWARNIVVGRSYDAFGDGAEILNAVRARLAGASLELIDQGTTHYGTPRVILPRLGQGSFRAAVTDAYGRSCAMTGDRVLHVLEAAHIRPFARGVT